MHFQLAVVSLLGSLALWAGIAIASPVAGAVAEEAVAVNNWPEFVAANAAQKRPALRMARHRAPQPQDDMADEPMRAETCALAGQVKLCANHAAMQRATCAGDDYDCQCIWAGVMVTCFSPCIADRDAADGMHIAKGDQETVCSQAAKFGKIAKDRERQRLDEKNNKGKKKEQVMTSIPRDINDLNSAHDFAAPSPVPDAANKPKNAASGSAKGGAGGNGSALSGAKGAKDLAGGDKQIPLAGSGAAGTFAMSLYTFGVAAVAMALL